MKKYPLLTQKDVSFLNRFFNQSSLQEIYDEYEKNTGKYKKNKKKAIIISVISVLVVIYLLMPDIDSFRFEFMHLLWVWFTSIIAYIFFLILYKGLLKYYGGKLSDWNVLSDFVQEIDKNLEFSKTSELFVDTLPSIKKLWFLEKYSRVDYIEDSMRYIVWEAKWEKDWKKQKSIEITWCELKTSQKKKSKDRTYYVTTNHCYLMKIDFKNPRFSIKKPITLLEDISENYTKKFAKVLWIQLAIIITFLSMISWDENSDWYIEEFLAFAWQHIEISITFLIGMFCIIWFIFSYMRWKRRVKLENIEFEKEFDVFSDDWIESRKLLTPSFMYRLVDYVNKINHKRVYELFFYKNFCYIKYNFLKTNNFINGRSFSQWKYLEFSSTQSLERSLEEYVEFYLEIKNIISLSKDLKLFYYDKWMMSKKILK